MIRRERTNQREFSLKAGSQLEEADHRITFRFKIGSVGGKEQEERSRKRGGREWGMDNAHAHTLITGITVPACLR